MEGLFTHDPLVAGTKGLVFIGDKVLVYRRDMNTDLFPLSLDLPSGGTETGEKQFETFRRELLEEFSLGVHEQDIMYAARYDALYSPGKYSYFLAARLPANAASGIVFGDEGTEWMLMDLDEFIARDDTWPILKERVADYLLRAQ